MQVVITKDPGTKLWKGKRSDQGPDFEGYWHYQLCADAYKDWYRFFNPGVSAWVLDRAGSKIILTKVS